MILFFEIDFNGSFRPRNNHVNGILKRWIVGFISFGVIHSNINSMGKAFAEAVSCDEFPNCGKNENDCPENEGYGCCGKYSTLKGNPDANR